MLRQREEWQFTAPSEQPPVARILHLVETSCAAGKDATDECVGNLAAAASALDHRLLTCGSRQATLEILPRDAGGEQNGLRLQLGSLPAPLRIPPFAGSRQLSAAVQRLIASASWKPDLVHAHGSTQIAAAGAAVAAALALPLVISVRPVPTRKRRVLQHFGASPRRAWESARQILLHPSWVGRHSWRAPVESAQCALLPDVAVNAARVIRPAPPSRGFVANLPPDDGGQNGITELLWAVAIAAKRFPDLHLDLIGDARTRANNQVRSLVAQLGIAGHVSFAGELPLPAFLARIPDYTAYVLAGASRAPAMRLIQSLCAGVPAVLPRDADTFGFLEGLHVGVAVDARRVEDIAEALSLVWEQNHVYRNAIRAQSSELYERFSPEAVGVQYLRGLEPALSRQARPW